MGLFKGELAGLPSRSPRDLGSCAGAPRTRSSGKVCDRRSGSFLFWRVFSVRKYWIKGIKKGIGEDGKCVRHKGTACYVQWSREYRVHFPRFLAIFRAYFPRVDDLHKAFALISPDHLSILADLQGVSRLFPPNLSEFSAYSPGRNPGFESFRAYFPQGSAPSKAGKSRLSRLFPPTLMRAEVMSRFPLMTSSTNWQDG